MVEFIAQRYRIETELGQGGMGTVYKGLDTHTNQTVAIKHLKPELTAPELIERFKREGEALRELNHPNIVKMLDAVEENNNHYLIIEYLAGGDLADLLKRDSLPLEKVLQIAIDICDALTRAHRLSIIHRDLKPANVLIAADGTPRLTDFGIAHFAGKARVTASDAIVGTVDYLAPEILDGELADPRADIWAFGVMLFEMLAGQRPFTGQSLAQTLMALVTQPTPDLEELCPDAPVALVDLVYRMLEKDPHARIASVRHVGAALEDILQGRTTDSIPIAQATRFDTPVPDFLQRPKHNLPAQTTPFVGRESELGELARLIENPNTRLLSILAPGGMGKTRLAVELAERQLARFEHGVYIVELAPLNAIEQIIPAIASALNFQFQSDGRETKQQLIDFLQNKQLLLIMDNYEHLGTGANLVTELLKTVSSLKILVTSRERLDQQGEALFHLSGMEFPTWESPQDALNYAAVKLFMNSARLAQPGFELTPVNLNAVARICRLVAGMPLGILLAASWLGMLTPQEIATELQKNLDFLESDSQQIPSRQRSIRVVMDYSWQQMSLPEQQVFMKLSVFRGGFTREAAESVAGANLRILMSLLNKSLLRRDTESGRYEIHELLRQYAEEQCQQANLLDATHDQHAQFFAEWAAKHEPDLKSVPQLETLSIMEADYLNIQSAWNWLLEHQGEQAITHMMRAMTVFFILNENANAAIQFFIDASTQLDKSTLQTQLRVRAAFFGLRNSHLLPPKSDKADFVEAMIDESFEKAFTLFTHVHYELWLTRNFEQGLLLIDEVIRLFETLNEKWWLAQAYYLQGHLYHLNAAHSKSFAAIQTAYNTFLETGAKWSALGATDNLAIEYFASGEFDKGLKLIRELNLERRKHRREGLGMMHSLTFEAMFLEDLGAYEDSIALLQEVLALALHHNSISNQFDTRLRIADRMGILKRYDEAYHQIRQAEDLYLAHFNSAIGFAWLDSSKGYIAYHHTDYQTAMNYFLSAYRRVQDESEHRNLLFFQLMLGLCHVKLGNTENAYRNLGQVVANANYTDQHIALYGFAEIAYRQGDLLWAAELTSSLIAARAMLEPYKSYAKEMLVSLENSISADDYALAIERGKSLDLKAVIQDLVDKFSKNADE
jgi:serine/threonine protein kinase/tetratricopeptide (TPR) repeat protein